MHDWVLDDLVSATVVLIEEQFGARLSIHLRTKNLTYAQLWTTMSDWEFVQSGTQLLSSADPTHPIPEQYAINVSKIPPDLVVERVKWEAQIGRLQVDFSNDVSLSVVAYQVDVDENDDFFVVFTEKQSFGFFASGRVVVEESNLGQEPKARKILGLGDADIQQPPVQKE